MWRHGRKKQELAGVSRSDGVSPLRRPEFSSADSTQRVEISSYPIFPMPGSTLKSPSPVWLPLP